MHLAHKNNEIEFENASFRLKKLRRLLNLTAKDLSDEAGIPLDTIRSWESPSRTSLTAKGAIRLIEFFKSKKIDCTIDWLLYGYGLPPISSTDKVIYEENQKLQAQEFQKKYKNSVVIEVKDDAMTPFLVPGDLLGGIEYTTNHLSELDGSYCIVSDPSSGLVCRFIKIIDNELHALPYNIHSKVKPLQNIKPATLAKVCCIWKR